MPIDYDAEAQAQAIDDYCSVADGFIVTIPYVNVTNIRLVLASLNACYAQRPDVKVMLTNTDQAYRAHEWGYLDFQWAGYSGDFSYRMGDKCGRFAMTGDLDIADAGRPIGVTPARPVEIYLPASELNNAGLLYRGKGIRDAIDGNTQTVATLGSHSNVKFVNYVSDHNSDHYVIALGVGAYEELTNAGIVVDFQCGDDQDRGLVPYYGQTVYAQGMQATGQLWAILKDPVGEGGVIGSTSAVGICDARVCDVDLSQHDAVSYNQDSDLDGDGLRDHPYQPMACPYTLITITHAQEADVTAEAGTSTFWGLWKSASGIAAQEFDYTFVGPQTTM